MRRLSPLKPLGKYLSYTVGIICLRCFEQHLRFAKAFRKVPPSQLAFYGHSEYLYFKLISEFMLRFANLDNTRIKIQSRIVIPLTALVKLFFGARQIK